MNKIDKLLLKLQRTDKPEFTTAVIGQRTESGKWEAYINLWDKNPNGERQHIKLEYDTLEEAERAVNEIKDKYPTTGGDSKNAIIIIDNIEWAE